MVKGDHRDACGKGFGIGIDFHRRVHNPIAKFMAKEVGSFSTDSSKKPVLPENNEALREIAAHTCIPIATVERMYSRWDFKTLLSEITSKSSNTIFRSNVPDEQLLKVVNTLIDNGIRAIEVTLNSAGALGQNARLEADFRGSILLGAGTVTGKEGILSANKAGATYLIIPYVSEAVAVTAGLYEVPVLMGAMTPTEIARAIGVGGVTPDNVGDYLRNRTVGAGVGNSLVNKKDLLVEGWEQRLAERARSCVDATR